MQAIADYESQHFIPPDWVNFAISRSNPHGAWQRIERGEIPLDETFFSAFRADLHNQKLWEEYHGTFAAERRRRRQPEKEEGDNNTSSTSASSLESSKGADTNTRQDAAAEKSRITKPVPPMPWIDAAALFWRMMSLSRYPDPVMYPVLRYLRTYHTDEFILGALTNNIIFPPEHPFSRPPDDDLKQDIKRQFDVFVASAEVGMRKPSREIYELALRELDRKDRERGGKGVQAGEVVFLDDIGGNLKAAREVGFRTVKVGIGSVEEAVRELGEVIRVDLKGGVRKLKEEEERGGGSASGRGKAKL